MEITKIFREWVYLIFPIESQFSNTVTQYISNEFYETAFDKLKILTPTQKEVLTSIYVAFPYDGAVSDVIEKGKRGGERLVFKELGRKTGEKIFSSSFFIPPPSVIIPVPQDPKRAILRGYDHTYIIAENIKRIHLEYDLPTVVVPMLKKVTSTSPQAELDKHEREKNLIGAFSFVETVDNLKVLSRCEIIWIVDDISTTGSTLFECGKIIHALAPFASIYGVVCSGN